MCILRRIEFDGRAAQEHDYDICNLPVALIDITGKKIVAGTPVGFQAHPFSIETGLPIVFWSWNDAEHYVRTGELPVG